MCQVTYWTVYSFQLRGRLFYQGQGEGWCSRPIGTHHFHYLQHPKVDLSKGRRCRTGSGPLWGNHRRLLLPVEEDLVVSQPQGRYPATRITPLITLSPSLPIYHLIFFSTHLSPYLLHYLFITLSPSVPTYHLISFTTHLSTIIMKVFVSFILCSDYSNM